MPDTPINVIELIGTIIGREESLRFLQFDVYDGTGTMRVIFKRKKYKQQRRNRLKLDKYYNVTREVQANAPRLMNQVILDEDGTLQSIQRRRRFQIANKLWWSATSKGQFGKKLKVGDYVNVFGFCALKYHQPGDSTSWDLGVLPKMIFVAVHVDVIDEEKYENKFQEFIDKGIKKYAHSN